MHSYRRADMVTAIEALPRYIATSRVASEQRFTVFTFVESAVRPGDSLVALALDDIYSLGVLHSYLHQLWFEARCSSLKADLRYTSSTVWDSFPWPQNPTTPQATAVENITSAILDARAANLARGMSLAQQYDTLRTPGKSKLRDLHRELDVAVVDAYGFTSTEDQLAQLFALNHDLIEAPAA